MTDTSSNNYQDKTLLSMMNKMKEKTDKTMKTSKVNLQQTETERGN